MRRRSVVLGMLAVGCAGGGADVAAEVDAAIEAELRRRPAFYTNGTFRGWRVTRDGRDAGTLWGTMHVGYDETTVLPRAIRARFAAAASVSVEQVPELLPVEAQTAWRRAADAALRPDPAALGRLGPEVRAALSEAGVGRDEEEQYSLLALAGLVDARALAGPAPLLPGTGIVDLHLIGFARSVGIPVRALERSSGYVDPAQRDPNGPDAAARLRLALRRRDGTRAFSAILGRLYASGRVDRVLAAAVAWRAEPADLRREDAAEAEYLLRRTRQWLPELERTLGEDGTQFVAFGAGHLMGPGGAVALLRERGWTVAPCLDNRCV